MKKIAIISLIIITMFLCSCKPQEYTFPNKGQPVEKIELLYNAYANESDLGGPMENICILTGKEADVFMEELFALETSRCITPPPTGYGFYVARVIYQNGDVEMFGSRHIEFIAKGAEPKGIGAYSFSMEAFEELFFEYAGDFDVPEAVVYDK